MIESKHTPGPWELDDDGTISDASGSCIGFVQPHGNVNTIASEGETFSRADGLVMAAAPEMLAALNTSIAWLQVWLDEDPCDCEDGHRCGRNKLIRDLEQARAAIATTTTTGDRP